MITKDFYFTIWIKLILIKLLWHFDQFNNIINPTSITITLPSHKPLTCCTALTSRGSNGQRCIITALFCYLFIVFMLFIGRWCKLSIIIWILDIISQKYLFSLERKERITELYSLPSFILTSPQLIFQFVLLWLNL